MLQSWQLQPIITIFDKKYNNCGIKFASEKQNVDLGFRWYHNY